MFRLFNQKNAIDPFILAKTEALGIRMKFLTHKDDLVLSAMLRGEKKMCKYFLAELDILKDLIQPMSTVLDAGANIGIVSIALAKAQPTAKIYSFEPDPLNCALLNVNIMLNKVKNVNVFNHALGIKEEFIEFYQNSDNFGDHRSYMIEDSISGTFKKLPMKVKKVTPGTALNNIIGQNAPEYFDLLKIDTQGSDFEILAACMSMIKQSSVVAIEYSPYHLYRHGTSKDDVESLLRAFSIIQRIIPNDKKAGLEKISIKQMISFYENNYKDYNGYYDVLLTY